MPSEAHTERAIEVMTRFAERTGLTPTACNSATSGWPHLHGEANVSAGGPLAEVGRPGATMCVVVRTDEGLEIAREPLATVREAPPG
jgi:hypothetical protein